VEAIEKKGLSTLSFVRPTTPPREPKERQKRDACHDAGRRRETPTRTVPHALERCPDCWYALRGERVKRTRRVIDLPDPAPAEVTAQRFITRHCPACDRWHTPTWDPTGQALGQGRIGVRLVSLIGYLCLSLSLSLSLRLPLRQIQDLLATLHQVRLSRGGPG